MFDKSTGIQALHEEDAAKDVADVPEVQQIILQQADNPALFGRHIELHKLTDRSARKINEPNPFIIRKLSLQRATIWVHFHHYKPDAHPDGDENGYQAVEEPNKQGCRHKTCPPLPGTEGW